MKKPIRIQLDGPYYPKLSRFQRVWNWLMVAIVIGATAMWLL